MKKIISLICCVAMLFSLCATSAFAAAPNVEMVVDNTSVKVGETITVTLNQGAINAASFAGKVIFDKEYFVVKSVVDFRNQAIGYVKYDDLGEVARQKLNAFATPEAANTTGEAGYSLMGTGVSDWLETAKIITVTFEAVKAGTTSISAYETSDGATAYSGTHSATAITIEANAPVLDEEKTVASNPVIDDAAETKTFAVTVGADLVGTGVTAVLAHPTHGEQEVGLTFDGWTGGAKAVFDVVVKFLDFANAADTTLTLK